MIKPILIAVFFSFAFSTWSKAQKNSYDKEWIVSYQEAVEKAKLEGKTILINFSGSDWCRPCIFLKNNILETKTFKNYAKENLILLLVDFPRLAKNQPSEKQKEHNRKLGKKHNPEGAFPTLILMDKNESVLLKKSGIRQRTPEEFIAQIDKVIGK